MKIIIYVFIFLGLLSCSRTVVPTYNPAAIESGLVPAIVFDGKVSEQLNVQDRMERYGVSAFSIALLADGEIVWVKAYGTYSKTDMRPISTNTLFQAASLSKAITALGVMKLVDEGTLTLDGSANGYLKTWQIPNNGDFPDPIQISGLLSHTAGISMPSYSGYELGENLPSLDEILAGKSPSKFEPVGVISPPGTYSYSGGGYMVLQKIIEDQVGKPFSAFMDEALFLPLGLQHTTFEIKMPIEDIGDRDIAMGSNWTGVPYENG